MPDHQNKLNPRIGEVEPLSIRPQSGASDVTQGKQSERGDHQGLRRTRMEGFFNFFYFILNFVISSEQPPLNVRLKITKIKGGESVSYGN